MAMQEVREQTIQAQQIPRHRQHPCNEDHRWTQGPKRLEFLHVGRQTFRLLHKFKRLFFAMLFDILSAAKCQGSTARAEYGTNIFLLITVTVTTLSTQTAF